MAHRNTFAQVTPTAFWTLKFLQDIDIDWLLKIAGV